MAKAQSIKNDVDALFIERERAQVTLDSIGDAVASTDFRGHVRYLNKAAEQLTGVSQEDAFADCDGRRIRQIRSWSNRL